MNQSLQQKPKKISETESGIKTFIKNLFKDSDDKPKPQKINPPQSQNQQPGMQYEMHPEPISMNKNYKPAGKLVNKIALVTGGDSGIGKAIVLHFIAEGAKVAFTYLDEDKDARQTQHEVNKMGGECIAIAGDLGDKNTCQRIIHHTLNHFGKINILVNNVAEQHPEQDIQDISQDALIRTFQTNFFSYFYMSQLVLPYLHEDDVIINTASVTAYHGHKELVDYASTKGAIVAFTRSLALSLVDKQIRVNAVAPGPIWTPLIPASFTKKQVAKFGSNTPMARPGQPCEVAPCYVFLASQDSSYITGQVIHPNGGGIVNG